jgi:hypothetical protein
MAQELCQRRGVKVFGKTLEQEQDEAMLEVFLDEMTPEQLIRAWARWQLICDARGWPSPRPEPLVRSVVFPVVSTHGPN